MDDASVQRIANHKSDAKESGTELPEHLASLPDETHIVTGTIVGNGATELASVKATLSSRVVKLTRNDAGGVDYQLAIFISEPAPAPVAKPEDAIDPEVEAAVAYFVGKGFPEASAREQVKRFGVKRVLDLKNKELDEELAKTVKKDEELAKPVAK